MTATTLNLDIESDQDFWSGMSKGLTVTNVDVKDFELIKNLLKQKVELKAKLSLTIDYAIGYQIVVEAVYNVVTSQSSQQDDKQMAKAIIENKGVFLSPDNVSLYVMQDSHEINYPKDIHNKLKKFYDLSDFDFHYSDEEDEDNVNAWVVGSECEDYKPTEWVTMYLDALSTPRSEARIEEKPCIDDDDHKKLQETIKQALLAAIA